MPRTAEPQKYSKIEMVYVVPSEARLPHCTLPVLSKLIVSVKMNLCVQSGSHFCSLFFFFFSSSFFLFSSLLRGGLSESINLTASVFIVQLNVVALQVNKVLNVHRNHQAY